MRLVASLLAFSLAAGPAFAQERDERDRPRPARPAPPPPDAPPPPQYTPPPPPDAPPPAPYARPAPPRAPYARPAPPPGGGHRVVVRPGVAVAGVAALPFWWGYGWGWGYYPLYPRYPQPYAGDGYGPGYPAPEPDRVHLRLGAAAAGMTDGAAGGFSLALDGRTAGFNASVDALAIEDVTHVRGASGDALGWGTAHVTWSLLADASFRVRVELGGSMLSLPSTGAFATATRAGDVAFGPDVGVSGQLGLIGPIGVEGHARVTPFPYPVVDTRLALALRGGPFAVTAGWRDLRVHGEQSGGVVEVPDVHFYGPEIGLSLLF